MTDMAKVTTTRKIKKEILTNVTGFLDACCQKAFLSGVFFAIGSLTIRGRDMVVSLSTENEQLLKVVQSIMQTRYGEYCEYAPVYNNKVKNKTVFEMVVHCTDAMYDAHVLVNDGGMTLADSIHPSVAEKDCCSRSFVKGLFVGCGTASFPPENSNSGYHLEFFVSRPAVADSLAEFLRTKGFHFKQSTRGDGVVVYVKDSGTVADLLSYMDAPQSLFELENLLVNKSIRNTVNRQQNCYIANLGKAVAASVKQVKAIEYIEREKGLDYLPDNLAAVARARLADTSASLEELSEQFEGLTKSGIAHRLRKIEQIAKKIGKED